jgi:hypothetical protein
VLPVCEYLGFFIHIKSITYFIITYVLKEGNVILIDNELGYSVFMIYVLTLSFIWII